MGSLLLDGAINGAVVDIAELLPCYPTKKNIGPLWERTVKSLI